MWPEIPHSDSDENETPTTTNIGRSAPLAFVRRLLSHRRFPWLAALIGMLLCSPALRIGLQTDDHFYRAVLSGDFATWRDSPTRERLIDYVEGPGRLPRELDLFAFIRGDEDFNRRAIARGFLPWWAPPDLRIAFFRPLTALTHAADYRIWPRTFWAMHLHSLLWYGAAVFVVALLYRRLFGASSVAGLAALLFAIDDAHGFPAVWIANRNALLALFFGALAMLWHHRCRTLGSRAAAILAPFMFLLALLSNEGAIAVFGYLVAFALFLDKGSPAARLRSLLPCAAVGIAWSIVYKFGGYGASGSGLYVDPGAHPLAFLRQAIDHAPRLLFGQFGLPSDMQWMMSQRAASAAWWIAIGFLGLIAVLIAPLVRRDRLARFWAAGMLISLVPACATFASDRLLFFAGIGGMGLLAQLLAAVVTGTYAFDSRAWRKWPARAVCVVLGVIHLILAPLGLLQLPGNLERFDGVPARAAASLPWDATVRGQTVLIVNTPTCYVSAIAFLIRALERDAVLPEGAFVLGSGLNTTEIRRLDDNTLVVAHAGGFLAEPGSPEPGREREQPLFDVRNGFAMLDLLYRGGKPMRVGDRIEMNGVRAEIRTVTTDGRPAEVAFHFTRPLDDPGYRWLCWQDGVYVPFELPREGESIRLPPVSIGI